MALVCSSSLAASVGYPPSKFALHCLDRGDDDAARDGKGRPGHAKCTERKLHFQAIRDLAVGQGEWVNPN